MSRRKFIITLPNPLYLVWLLWTYKARRADRERRARIAQWKLWMLEPMDVEYRLDPDSVRARVEAPRAPFGWSGHKEVLDLQPERLIVRG